MAEVTECMVDGCTERVAHKKLCRTHYHREWRLGSATAPLTRSSPNDPLIDRFRAVVTGAGSEECWVWRGAVRKNGYGVLSVEGRKMAAHRLAYQLLTGPIPDGQELDHLCHTRDLTCPGGNACRHRRCVNPAHLEPTTGRVNRLRGRSRPAANAVKTHCTHGHPFDDANTYITKSGGRACRACVARFQREYKARKKAAEAAK
jgi:hypothetical protein